MRRPQPITHPIIVRTAIGAKIRAQTSNQQLAPKKLEELHPDNQIHDILLKTGPKVTILFLLGKLRNFIDLSAS